MDKVLREQLERWHENDEFDKIISAIEALPKGERDYELTGLLARAYENGAAEDETEPFEKAVALLLETSLAGERDPNWHFRMGYALYWLGREPDAAPCFRRALELLPNDPKTQEEWEDCRELLQRCERETELREAQAQYGDGDTLDPQKAMDYLLHVGLHHNFAVDDIVEGDHLYLPRWQLTITPKIGELSERGAILNFYLYAPQWGKELYECAMGMNPKPKTAMGMALGSFLFSFMQGVTRMENRESPLSLESSFAGRPHRWQAYVSDIVGMGTSPQAESVTVYWDVLKDELAKRLGNQKLCYVKVYGARVNGEVIGECRIDDIKSGELSAKVAEVVSQWDDLPFASHKQFFFIRQEEETALPGRYEGLEGRARLKDKVIEAVRMFHECGENEYCTLPDRMAQALGDPTLAAECYSFLPEMCAENAFDELIYPETLDIKRGDGPKETYYKNQLADYWPICQALFSAFEEGVFGDETNTIFREYIGTSSIYNVVCQMKEQESDLKDCRLTSLLFQVDADFKVR